MKRVDFLKRLGIGLGAVVVAPMVLAEMPAKEKTHPAFNENLINKRLSELRKYPLTYDECYVPDWSPSMGVPEGWRVPSRYELEQLCLLQKDINNQIFLGG